MTSEFDVSAADPLPLHFPHYHLSQAMQEAQSALSLVRGAEDVSWVSIAADAYRRELDGLRADVERLVDAVGRAQQACSGADSVAGWYGQ